MRRSFGAAAVLLPLVAIGCSDNYWTSNIREVQTFPVGTETMTNADVRLVHHVRGYELVWEKDPNGTPNQPNMLVRYPRDFYCAEPSPDVARVVQASLSFQGNAAANVVPPAAGSGTAVEAQLALALAASRSEGIAQLTKRIATIQLLRDGLYRACEAYMNGALDKVSYGAILANYDNIMITMLLGEMAAGNFGSAALLTGSASAGTPTSSSDAAQQRLATANKELDDRQATAKDARDQATTARSNLAQATDSASRQALAQTVQDKGKAVQQADAAVASAQSDVQAAQLAARAAEANASASSSGQVSDQSAAAQAASTLLQMQREYFLVPRGNSALLACMEAAMNPFGKPAPSFCGQLLAELPGNIEFAVHQRFFIRAKEAETERLRAVASVYEAGAKANIPKATVTRSVAPP